MSTTLRLGKSQYVALTELLFSRYPYKEWATFAFSGWKETENGLVVTFATLRPPAEGELSKQVDHVQFLEPYTLRIALEAETVPLAVTVIHSHPENYQPIPSWIDDDMDGYYAQYFSDFAKDRPYISFIVSLIDNEPHIGGRVHWKNQWHVIDNVIVEGTPVTTVIPGKKIAEVDPGDRVKRLSDAFGLEAAKRLRQSTAAIIGVGGTGSATAEVLARAGVGRIILIDPDSFTASNLERVHGSEPKDVEAATLKVELARRHIESIDPTIRVEGIIGRVPQARVVDALLEANIVLGCTDSHATRVALGDLSWQYLLPILDVGVSLEGKQGHITGQVIQIVYFGPGAPCALCQKMYSAERITYELMSDADKTARKAAAAKAISEGADPTPYWRDYPQLNTVGYLTTTAGALIAGYAIGIISGRFLQPFTRIQFDLVAPLFGAVDSFYDADKSCSCQTKIGWGITAAAHVNVTAPSHWSPVKILRQ